MKQLIRILAILLALTVTIAALTSCEQGAGSQGEKGEQGDVGPAGPQGEKGDTGRGILKTEIIDGWLYITYTDDPKNPVKIGKVGEGESEGTEGLDYYLLPDGTYAVSGGTAKYMTEIVIPATHNGKAVTVIMGQAFCSFPNLTKLEIPVSVTFIGGYAFSGCNVLKNLTFCGTKENWNKIAFDYLNWKGTATCTDGIVTVNSYKEPTTEEPSKPPMTYPISPIESEPSSLPAETAR